MFHPLCALLRLGGQMLLELGLALFVHEQAPDAAEETIHAFDALGAPRFGVRKRAHEHFVEPQGISAEFVHHVVGIDDVAARFGHFLVVFAEDKTLVDKFVKRLGCRDVTEVVKDLVPETRVEQVQHGMFGAADV